MLRSEELIKGAPPEPPTSSGTDCDANSICKEENATLPSARENNLKAHLLYLAVLQAFIISKLLQQLCNIQINLEWTSGTNMT